MLIWLIKFSCFDCRGNKRSQSLSNACSSDLWSVNTINFVPSKKIRKYPIAAQVAISSRWNVLYLFSVAVNFYEKIPMVANWFLSSVALPLPLLCIPLRGNANNVALTSSGFILSDAPSDSADHSNFVRSCFLDDSITFCSGISISTAWEIFLSKFIAHKKLRKSCTSIGILRLTIASTFCGH